METNKRLVQLLFCLVLPIFSQANSTLTLTLINESNITLEFERSGVICAKENTLLIDKDTLLPGDTATVTGTIEKGCDLAGHLYFHGNRRFVIRDPRQFHVVPYISLMEAHDACSKIESKTSNPIIHPRLLKIIASTVTIKDKGTCGQF